MNLNTRSLDGLRFLFALWVAIGHFYIIIGAQNFFSLPIITKVLTSPWAAVDGFIIITGFLMTYNYFKREAKEPVTEFSTAMKFIVRRLFRLYPVYLIAIVVAFFLVSDMYAIREDVLVFFTGTSLTPFGTESKMEVATISGLLSHLFFVHGLIPEHESSILSVAWSLSLEMQFYVLFPLLFVIIFKKLKPAQSLLILALFTLISELLLKYMLFGHQPAMILFKLPLFMLGMIVAAYALSKISKKYFLLGLIIILPFQAMFTILLFAVILSFLFLNSFKSKIPHLIFSPLNVIERFLSSKFSSFGADISYSLYLLHLIILPFILEFFMGITDSKLLVAGYSLISFLIINVIISYVLFQLVEKRFIVIGRNVVNKISINMNLKNTKELNIKEHL